MDPQNLAYALAQVAHNFGAVAVTGGAVAALLQLRAGLAVSPRLGWLVLVGWGLQAASGAGFGAISVAWYGQFPDLHGIAVVALAIKVSCAATAFALAAASLRFAGRWSAEGCRRVWTGLVALAATALSAAAFLRWFA